MHPRLRAVSDAATCLAGGLLVACSFIGPYRWVWILTPLGLALLLRYVYVATPRVAALRGYLFGLGWFGLGLNWTHTSLYEYGNLPLAGALALALGLSSLLAFFPAAACWLGRKKNENSPAWLALLQLTCAWLVVEHIRTWLFGGFGWLAVGYSQVPHSALSGYVPVIGAYGATAMCLVLAALLVLGLHVYRNQHCRVIPLALAVVVLAIGLGLRQINFTTTVGEKIPVSVLQGAIPQKQQWLRNNTKRIPQIYLDLLARAQGKLIVAPESALPFTWALLPATLRTDLNALLAKRNAALILGTFDHDENGQSRNIAVIMHNGNEQVYAKRHLTPYGEYLPLADLFEPLLRRANIPFSQLVSGAGDGLIELPFVQLGLSICYEDLFPELFASPPAEVLINITNDSWFDGSWMPRQHAQISIARAMEHGRWLIRASNTGPSLVIRPNGSTSRWIGAGVRGKIDTEVYRHTGTTPYVLFGDWPTLLAAIAALLFRWRRVN